jgi:hypothetical protein
MLLDEKLSVRSALAKAAARVHAAAPVDHIHPRPTRRAQARPAPRPMTRNYLRYPSWSRRQLQDFRAVTSSLISRGARVMYALPASQPFYVRGDWFPWVRVSPKVLQSHFAKFHCNRIF